jgi:hypothetical protein
MSNNQTSSLENGRAQTHNGKNKSTSRHKIDLTCAICNGTAHGKQN